MSQTHRHHYCVIKHPYGVNVELLQIPCSLSAVHSGKDSQEQIHPPAAYVLLLRATYVSQLMARIRDERCIYGRRRGRRDHEPVLHISWSTTRIVISNENH